MNAFPPFLIIYRAQTEISLKFGLALAQKSAQLTETELHAGL